MTRGLLVYRGHASGVSTVTWSPDGLRLASSSRREVHLWDAVLGQHLATYAGHFNHIRRVAWSPDGQRIASASADATVQVWSVV